MTPRAEEVAKGFYRGFWGVLVRWFRVPERSPRLPTHEGAVLETFHPDEGFLRYLKFRFWVALALVDLAILVGWIVLTIAVPLAGIIVAPLALVVAVVPDLLAYVAIHLRYDTTWYAMTDRSLRIRRGIWVIHETTITFENVQNVSVSQGPLQRWFGIATLLVETAGGGGPDEGSHSGGHYGVVEGVADAKRIRELILARLRRSAGSGLGDESVPAIPVPSSWSAEQLTALAAVRDAARALLIASKDRPADPPRS